MTYLEYNKKVEQLLEKIKSGNAKSPLLISEEFDCSERTVRRMINYLRDTGYTINYCKKNKIYYVE